MDPKGSVSDTTPDPDPTFKEVSAPTPDPEPTPDPVSDLATLVSASRKLRGNYANVFVT